jgi:putative inorganic carbon (HCO3(-)) transporter
MAAKWHSILALAGTVLLAAVTIALGLAIGKKMTGREWTILVTATGLGIYVAVAVIDVRHAFLFWIVTAPFARFLDLEIELGRRIPNLTLNRLMVGTLLILFLAQVTIHRRKLARFTWADFFLIIFCLAGIVSLLPSELGLIKAIQSYFDLIMVPIVIYFLARNTITTRRDLRTVMFVLLIVGCYFAFLATREQLTGNVWFYPEDRSIQYTRSIRRVVGLLGNPAYIAVTIAMAVPWAWYLFLKAHRRRVLLLMVIALMTAGVYFCMNRSGWAGLVISLVVLALFVPRFRRIFFLLLLVGVIVGGVYWTAIITSATVQERLEAQGPVDYRVDTWAIALRMIRDHPITGIGYQNFSEYYRRYGQWDIYLRAMPTPHNTYLGIILMGGIVAFVPFVAFLGAIAYTALKLYFGALRNPRAYPSADLVGTFLASLSAILVPAAVMDVLDGYYNTMIMFLILGAFFGAVTEEERRIHTAPSLPNALERV